MTELVIFDRDRVPVNREPTSDRVLAETLTAARPGAIEGEPTDDMAIPPGLAAPRSWVA